MTYKPLQTELLSAGYNPGPIDGKWGKSTLAALMAYGAGKPITPVIREAAEALVGAMVGKDITTPLRIMHFIAQMSHESTGFTRLTESLNYRPEVLLATFRSRIKTLDNAKTIVSGGAEAIAEAIYGSRTDLGNLHLGDGYLYRGRGFTMLTGRSNYTVYGDHIGLNLAAHPEMAAEPDVAARIAVQFWADKGLNALADRDDIEAVTLRVNGGANGLKERAAILARLKKVWRV